MTYYESAEGITITRSRALEELSAHGFDDYRGFFADNGNHETYDAQSVLAWLGY